MASQLHTNGATRLNIKYAGGWRCDKVVEGYVISSVGEKRRTAQMVSCDVAVDSIMPAPKKPTVDDSTVAEPREDPKKKDQIEKEMEKVVAATKKQHIVEPSPSARESLVVSGPAHQKVRVLMPRKPVTVADSVPQVTGCTFSNCSVYIQKA